MTVVRAMSARAVRGVGAQRRVTTRMAAKQGQKMQSFSLPSTKGGSTTVPSTKKFSVVFFFNKSDTPGCKAEADTFNNLYSEFEKKDVQVVGISMEKIDALTKSNEGREGVELLSDEGGKVSEQFDSELKIPFIGTKLGFSSRNTFLLSSDGEVLQAWQEGKNMGSVKDGKHAQEVLNAVDASM